MDFVIYYLIEEGYKSTMSAVILKYRLYER